MRGLVLCAVLLAGLDLSLADNPTYNNSFVYPSSSGPSGNFAADVVMPLGSTQKIEFITNVSDYSIYLFQQHFNPQSGQQLDSVYSPNSGATGDITFDWKVQLYGSKLSDSNVYFLWLNPGSPEGFSCHYFNISQTTTASSSSASPTSNASSASSATAVAISATPTSVSTTTPTSPATTSAAPNGGGSSSNTAVKVGLGVGLGIGIPLVLLAAAWLFFHYVRGKKSAENDPSAQNLYPNYSDAEHPWDGDGQKDNAYQMNVAHEAPDDNAVQELSGERPQERPAELRGS